MSLRERTRLGHYTRKAVTRLVACAVLLMPISQGGAQTDPQLRLIRKPIVSIAAPTFIRIRVSPAKAAINSDRAIAEKLTAAW
jgi:hypothetical protein